MELTFEQLPKAVTLLYDKLENIEKLLQQKQRSLQSEPDQWFNLTELRNYHPDKPASATVYAWVSRNEVPFHKQNKKLRFLKSEIDEWLKSGKQLANSEIIDAADKSLKVKQHA
jgi:excisionase family DNA binding protein